MADEKKIIIDEDWERRYRRRKKRLQRVSARIHAKMPAPRARTVWAMCLCRLRHLSCF